MKAIKIISPGLLTTIQDLGRYEYRSQGIPVSGAMDQSSAILANVLVGNLENSAVLECTMLGPKIQFLCNTFIAITGADVDIYLNDKPQKLNTTIYVTEDSILKFGRLHNGCRFYIGIAAGLNLDKTLGSYSTDTVSKIGPLPLSKGQLIEINDIETRPQIVSFNPSQKFRLDRKIKVFKGPEYDLIKDISFDDIYFTIDPSSNRMAYMLHSPLDISHSLEMISSGVLPGTIQLTPDGRFIILMRDAQTTGGYPRVLQVDEDDLDFLGQLRGGESIKFELMHY